MQTPVESAQAALAEGDFAAAIGHLQVAVAAGPDPVAREMLGGLLFGEDDLLGARRELEVAFREWRDAGQVRTAALVAATLADLHSAGLGNRVAGQGWVERARRLLAPFGRCVEQGYVELAVIACGVDDVERLEQAAGLALELATEFGDGELEVRALADGGYALVVQGRIAEGFARLDEAMAALSAGEVRNPAVVGMSYCALLAACDRTGDMVRAEEWTRVIRETVIVPLGGRPIGLHAHCRLVYGSVLCTAGRWSEGEAALLEVLGPNGTMYIAHRSDAAARLAALRLLQGRVEEAAALLAGFEDRHTSCEPLARLHLFAGDLDLAAAVAQRGLEAVSGDLLRASVYRSLLVEIELARDDREAASMHAEALEELAETTDNRLIRADAALALGRVAAAGLDPRSAIGDFERARACIGPADRPLLSGIITLELSESLAAVGQRGAAVDCARTAIATFDRLGASVLVDRTDALLRSLGVRARSVGRRPASAVAGLTARERQVLGLVRDGLTNAEIGERLFISGKTAEHHVGRVLAKLGVRSRAEAAAVAAVAAAPSSETPPD